MNLDEILSNAQKRSLIDSSVDAANIVEQIKTNLNNKMDLLIKVYKLDTEEDLNVLAINEQFNVDAVEESDTFKNDFGKVTNLYVPYGLLGFVSDCDIYASLKIILLSIYSRNSLVIEVNKNIGSIMFILNEVNQVFSDNNIKESIRLHEPDPEIHLEDMEDLDGIIYLGKRANFERLKISFDKKVIFSGYGNYELYIDDNLDESLINQIKKNKKVNIYSKKGIGIGKEVSGIDEAIAKINEFGNEYSAAIITKSRENAKEFVGSIKSRNVLVNASPTLVSSLDIEARDLMYKKSVLVYE